MPPSTLNSEKASSHSEAENLSPNRVTIWVKFMGPGASSSIPWASPEPMDLPWLPKAVTRSEAEMRPSLSQSMMPKASLNCWMAEWEKESKMLAFLGMVKLVGLTAGS